jgi:hypothetical protein
MSKRGILQRSIKKIYKPNAIHAGFVNLEAPPKRKPKRHVGVGCWMLNVSAIGNVNVNVNVLCSCDSCSFNFGPVADQPVPVAASAWHYAPWLLLLKGEEGLLGTS